MKVARTAEGLTHRNTLRLRKVEVYLQRYPGATGSDSDRGVSGVEYTLTIDGHVAHAGTSAADGKVTLYIPAGASAIFEALGSRYEIRLKSEVEDVTTVEGRKRRLDALGYEPGPIDATDNAAIDRAMQCFQADHNLDTSGQTSGAMETQLTTQAGV